MDSLTRSKRNSLAIKEGFLGKQGHILKSWSRKYFMLNKQSLVYFRKDLSVENGKSASGKSPQGRVFLSDVVKIEKETEERRKVHFTIVTKKHRLKLQAPNEAEMESWIESIQKAIDSEGEAEAKDPFRKSLRRLAPGLKRVSLTKDPVKGIGCTIKSAAGHIFVNAIVEDGPIAFTGALRPDDELLEVNGVTLKGMSIAEVGGVIRSCPQEFIATVRPVSALKKQRHNAPKGSYASRMSHIDYFSTPPMSPTQVTTPTSNTVFNHALSKSNGNCATPTLTIRPPTPDLPSNESPPPNAPPPSDSPPLIVTSDEGSICSNDDMGDYDDDTDY